MGARRAVAGLVAVLAVAACGGSPFSPEEYREAARALARWEARGFTDYAYEIRSSCFCPPDLTQWARVEVRGGVVTEVRSVATGVVLAESLYSMWSPIDELFTWLLREHDDDHLVDVRADFDRGLGYPTYISFGYDSSVMDAGATYYLRNVVPLD